MNVLIDTHTHIYLPEFKVDLDAVLANAQVAGVQQLLLPAIDSNSHNDLLQLAMQPQCLPMMGLHPCSVNAGFETELELVKNLLEARSFVAIGEIGLDFYWDKTFEKEQYTAFEEQLRLAVSYQLPVSIHSRNATDECIETVRRFTGVTGVFHCFSGTVQQAMAVMEAGLYLGIGGVATFKNGGLDKVLAETGLDRVVLETDAPYLAPVPFRGKRNEPAYLGYVVARLAQITGKPEQEVAAITTENARRVFNL